MPNIERGEAAPSSDPARTLPRKAGWNVLRMAAILAMILFVPLMRSCGRIGAGFPFVAVSQEQGPRPSVHWAGLALNLAIGAMTAVAAFAIARKVASARTRRILEGGFSFLGIYVALVYFGYLVVLPLMGNSKDGSLPGILFVGYAFFIHPFFGIVSRMQSLFPESLSSSCLFGDGYDLPMRLGFALMCLAWFALGCLRAGLASGKRKAAGERIPGGRD